MTVTFNSSPLRIILVGDESLTIACGDTVLIGGHQIAAVVTRDKAVRAWAEGQGLTVFEKPADLLSDSIASDWLLSIANLRMIPKEVLALPTKGAVNFHDGPLPRYAGLNTPAWAIINGETQHGVSWHVIENGVDEGDLLAQRLIDIAPDETAFSLNSKCYAAGMESFGGVLSQLEADVLERSAQDLSKRSYFAKDQRPALLGLLDFSQAAVALSSLVRGLDFGGYWNPLCSAKLAFSDRILSLKTLEILDAEPVTQGKVIAVEAGSLTVGTSSSPIRLSGFTTIEGSTANLTTLVTVGDVLASSDRVELDAKDENYWRDTLSHSDGIALGLVSSGGATQHEVLPLAAPRELSISETITAAALVALKSANTHQGMLALQISDHHDLCTNWVPVSLRVQGEDSVSEAVQKIETQLARASESVGMACDLLQRDPDLKSKAFTDVAVSLDGTISEKAAVTLIFKDGNAVLSYAPDRLSAEAAHLMVDRFNAGFGAFSNAATCSDVWALPQSELKQIATWNDTARDYPRETIHAGFEAQVARNPDATALIFEGVTLSYAELNARANQVAHTLRTMGAAAGTPIGIYTARGVEMLVGVLGILKAGGAYVPLDPTYPADRIAHYISDSGTPLIVSQSSLEPALSEHNAQVLLIDKDPRISAAPNTNPEPICSADSLAYLIYTSGSTGTPKGVMVNHGNVANFFAGMDDRIDYNTASVWLAVTSLSFDISVLELFWTLARGFKLVLAGDESRTLIANGPVAATDRKIDFNLFYWGNDDGVGPKKYELLLEGAKFADAHGFNAVWTPERHFHAFGGPYPNPSVTGAAVAAVTQNLDVRAGSCVAPLHHPARIAEEWAVIDNLTNGRVGLAIASGWQPDDFVLCPENTPPKNKPAMYRAIDQLRALWRGEAVEFPTKDGTPFAVVTQPRPVSKTLPIWVTTAGNPETWKEAGEIGANVLTHLLGQSVDEVADKIKIYHKALRGAGHDPADFKVTLMLHTYLADSRAEAEEVAREPMKDYLRSAAGLIKQYAWAFPAFKKPEGATTPFDVDLAGLSEDELDAILEFAFLRYFNDSGMFGTIEDGLARTEELKRIGVDEIACLIDYGIATEKVMAGLVPLAQVLAGANQAIAPADDDFSLAAQIVRHDVSHMQCTPSMAQMLVTNDDANATLTTLKHLMIGGEALPGSLVTALQKSTRATIQNMYGPTETTIWSTIEMLGTESLPTATIGTPIANTEILILDDKMNTQPIGNEGEMWIGGDGVTQGYWQRDVLTSERFVPNPYGEGKLYRTGDLAAWDAHGTLQFAGRVDAQVKIRGHRIELGEIEACLVKLPNVTQAVVNAVEFNGNTQLVGYVTGVDHLSTEEMQNQLRQMLPEIMVPGHFVTLDRMPLTPNKKIDRKALPVPKPRRALSVSAPQEAVSDTQTAISQVWCGLLGINDIRGEDNFFALGGHSLLAVQAHRDIKAALGGNLSITDIFRFPTLEGLAVHLDKGQGKAPATVAVQEDQPAKTETMSKRRAMRAGRAKAGA